MAALEFCLPPADLPGLLRRPVFGRRGGRATAIELVWHDTASSSLADDHLSLCQAGSRWRLERASPRPSESWPPGTPAVLIAEGADPAEFGPLPGPLSPVAGFRGRRRVIPLASDASATLVVLNGTMRGVTQEQPVCRIVVEGPAPLLAQLTAEWAANLAIAVPRCSLAVEAMALARGLPPPARRTGGPEVAPGMSVADAIALVVGHLTDVILAGAPSASAGESAEPVHVMRVAVRRLRSALSLFRRAADGAAFADVKLRLAGLARTLGEARDWDVFLAGIGTDVAAALPDDPRIRTLLAAASRRREAAYAALRRELASPGFRQLVVALVQFAALRPWQMEADDDRLAQLNAGAKEFAREALSRQRRHLLAYGPDVGALPSEDLHALRKQGKKLRYIAEFFNLFYGDRRTHRFLHRLSQLQEALGHLNDGAAAAALMQSLPGGAGRQFAAGAIQGFTAGRNIASRTAIEKAWVKLRHAKPFWL